MFKKLSTGFYFSNLYWIGSIILTTIIISSVFTATINTFFNRNEETLTIIPAIIQAKDQAIYADGIEGLAFAGVDLTIVDEVISDSLQGISNQEEVEERIANLVEEFQQPIPIATNFPTPNAEVVNNNSPTPAETENSFIATNTIIPVTGSSTRSGTAGITPSLTYSPSTTSTVINSPTNTFAPTWTLRTPTSSKRSMLTPTITKSQTLTYTFTPTSTLYPTLTFSPTFTRTNTLTPTLTPSMIFRPTFTIPPTITTSFTIMPTFTQTPTYTITPTWTSTFTPTPHQLW